MKEWLAGARRENIELPEAPKMVMRSLGLAEDDLTYILDLLYFNFTQYAKD